MDILSVVFIARRVRHETCSTCYIVMALPSEQQCSNLIIHLRYTLMQPHHHHTENKITCMQTTEPNWLTITVYGSVSSWSGQLDPQWRIEGKRVVKIYITAKYSSEEILCSKKSIWRNNECQSKTVSFNFWELYYDFSEKSFRGFI